MPTHGQINSNDPNFYWDANFGKWLRNPGSSTGGANLSLAQALSGVEQTQGGQDLASQLLSAGGNDPLSPPGGGGLGVRQPGDESNPGMPNQPGTRSPGGSGLRLEKDGQVYFKTDLGEIGRLLQQGYQVRDGNDPNGQLYTPKSFQGGYLVKSGDYWVPVDTLLSGNMTDAQRKALVDGGFQIDPGVTITGAYNGGDGGAGAGDGAGAGGAGSGSGSGYGNGLGDKKGLQLSGDLEAMLKQLMQQALDQGALSQNAFAELMKKLQSSADFDQSQTEKAGKARDSLVSALLGGQFDEQGAFTANDQGLLGQYNKIIGNIGTGLDPLTMAALNQQATEGPERDYQGQVESLKSALASRGAYGGGDTPGSFGDIVRGYAPLTTARDTTRQGLMQQNAFANQAQKNTNLTAGLNALGQENNLLGTVGGFYNPNAFANTRNSSLANALSGLSGYVGSGFKGLDTAGDLAGVLGDQSGNSLSSLLKAALASTASAGFLDWLKNRGSNSGSGENTGFLPDFNINIGGKQSGGTGGNWWDDLINSH